jgi:hypothetical protein
MENKQNQIFSGSALGFGETFWATADKLGVIRTCKPGDSLEGIKSKEEDLDDINDFATDFTHDSEADGSLQELDDAQLKNYAKRALAIARGA